MTRRDVSDDARADTSQPVIVSTSCRRAATTRSISGRGSWIGSEESSRQPIARSSSWRPDAPVERRLLSVWQTCRSVPRECISTMAGGRPGGVSAIAPEKNPARSPPRAGFSAVLAEVTGFEPARRVTSPTWIPAMLLRPLGHTSKGRSYHRRAGGPAGAQARHPHPGSGSSRPSSQGSVQPRVSNSASSSAAVNPQTRWPPTSNAGARHS